MIAITTNSSTRVNADRPVGRDDLFVESNISASCRAGDECRTTLGNNCHSNPTASDFISYFQDCKRFHKTFFGRGTESWTAACRWFSLREHINSNIDADRTSVLGSGTPSDWPAPPPE